jgi:hypothetical protein
VLAHRGQRGEDAVEVAVLAVGGGLCGDLGLQQRTGAQQLDRPRADRAGAPT